MSYKQQEHTSLYFARKHKNSSLLTDWRSVSCFPWSQIRSRNTDPDLKYTLICNYLFQIIERIYIMQNTMVGVGGVEGNKDLVTGPLKKLFVASLNNQNFKKNHQIRSVLF